MPAAAGAASSRRRVDPFPAKPTYHPRSGPNPRDVTNQTARLSYPLPAISFRRSYPGPILRADIPSPTRPAIADKPSPPEPGPTPQPEPRPNLATQPRHSEPCAGPAPPVTTAHTLPSRNDIPFPPPSSRHDKPALFYPLRQADPHPGQHRPPPSPTSRPSPRTPRAVADVPIHA